MDRSDEIQFVGWTLHRKSGELLKAGTRIRGRAAEADALLQSLIATSADGDPFKVAGVYADRGKRDAAFEWLNVALARGGTSNGPFASDALPYWKTRSPLLTPLHADPRWSTWLARAENPERRVASRAEGGERAPEHR